MTEEMYCIVNVWTSDQHALLLGSDWGHASIETKLGYYSLWPQPRTQEEVDAYHRAQEVINPKKRREGRRKNPNVFNVRPPFFMENYEKDLAAKKGRVPAMRIAFYGLNPELINQYFINVLRPSITKAGGWRLAGSNLFSRLGNSAESCASFVYRLLLAGGIRKLVKSFEMSSISSQNSSAVKPDKLLEQVLLAKVNELDSHAVTEQFRIEDQSDARALSTYLKSGGRPSTSNNNDNNAEPTTLSYGK